jgi:hypothetical protein
LQEIVIPCIEAFSHSTDYAYSPQEILNFEKVVLKWLKWRIQFPSLAFWGNYIMLKWDDFAINFMNYSFDMPNSFKQKIILPRFRNPTNEEYFLFRNFYQVIDVISLDSEHLKFSEKILSAATIYLLIGLFLKYFNIGHIVKEFAFDCQTYGEYYDFNVIFNRFLCNYLGCELDDVVEHIQFVSSFFNIKFDYKEPVVTKNFEDYEKV